MSGWVRFVAGLLVFALLVWFGVLQLEGAATFAALSWTWLIVLALAAFGVLVCNATLFFWLLRMFTSARGFADAFQLTAFNSLLNSILPVKAGLAFRGLYMKRVLGFPWSDYAVMTVSAQAIIIALALMLLVILLAIDPGLRSIILRRDLNWAVVLLILALFPLCALLVWRRFPGRTGALMGRSLQGWSQRPGLLAGYIVTAVAFLAAGALRFLLCFYALGHSVPFQTVLAIQCLLAAALFINITPGNLGLREAVIFLVSPLLGLEGQAALLAAVLDRAAALSVTLVAGACAFPPLSRRMADSRAAPKDVAARNTPGPV